MSVEGVPVDGADVGQKRRELGRRALLLAEAAMKIAERTQGRHVVHRGLGVQFNAAVALAQWGPAAQCVLASEEIRCP